jgi:hypothetical protein
MPCAAAALRQPGSSSSSYRGSSRSSTLLGSSTSSVGSSGRSGTCRGDVEAWGHHAPVTWSNVCCNCWDAAGSSCLGCSASVQCSVATYNQLLYRLWASLGRSLATVLAGGIVIDVLRPCKHTKWTALNFGRMTLAVPHRQAG